MKKEAITKADYLFEVSWEVCHQVGGIYTVIKSKAARIYDLYKENYFLIGPYYEEEAIVKFQGMPLPNEVKRIFDELKKDNIICHFGKWIIDGVKINTILIDFSKYMGKANIIKKELWEYFKIDSFNSDESFDEFVVWSYVSGRLLEGLRKTLKGKIVAQFHEYISGAGLLYLKKHKVKIATVFTTHATYLGRTLASAGLPLYDILKKIDPKKEAYKYKIQARYFMERVTAAKCEVFTTVSDITALEAQYTVGKKPDLVLPNGLDLERFPTLEERAIKHNQFKSQMMEFVRVFFFPYHQFNVENSLIYFISGRYEFKNKGIDVFIKALGRLNKEMIKDKISRDVIAFIWIPSDTKAIDPLLLKNKISYDGIENFMNNSLGELKSKIIHYIMEQKLPTTKELFTDAFHYQMKKKMIEFKQKGSPLVVTHKLENKDDIILKELKKAGLNNSSHDKVKVIYYPIYLTGADGLIDLSYYEAMMGCHFGIFPSYYEPWGYTPLETAALGVSSLTTDLSGFGKYIIKKHSKCKGICVLKRYNVSEAAVVNNLTKIMYDYLKLSAEERIQRKLEAKQIADLADWKNMVKYYLEAHNMAVTRLR